MSFTISKIIGASIYNSKTGEKIMDVDIEATNPKPLSEKHYPLLGMYRMEGKKEIDFLIREKDK